MKTVEGDLLLTNYTLEASRFFLNYRTPAALIAAASLQALLHLTRIHHKQDRRNKKKNRLEEWMVSICHINFLLAFALSLIILIISTTTEIRIYRGDFKPLAENVFDLLNKEFYFDFAAVRWCFLGSLFALIRGVGSHLLLEYNLLEGGKRFEGMIVFTAIVSVLTGLLSYMNDAGTMKPWSNYLCMTIDLIKMVWVDTISLQKPLLIVSLLALGTCTGLSSLYCFHSFHKVTKTNITESKKSERKEKVEGKNVVDDGDHDDVNDKVVEEKHELKHEKKVQ